MLSLKYIRIGIIFLFILLTLPFIYANVDFVLERENYKSFETVRVKVDITNISLSRDLDNSNLVLQRSDGSNINIAKNLVRINSNSYIYYFDLPLLNNGSYKLGVVNINYVKDGSFKIGSFFTNFSLISGDKQIISVRPAYVLSKVSSGQEAPFTLVINNKGSDIVSVSLSKDGDYFSLSQTSFNLAPFSSRNIDVSTSLFGKNNVSFSGNIFVDYSGNKYIIPFNIIRTDFEEEVVINESKNVTVNETVNFEINYEGLLFTNLYDNVIDKLDLDLEVDEYYPASQVIIRNEVGIDLHDLSYSFSSGINGLFDLRPSKVGFIKNNESAIFLFGLNESNKLKAGNYEGYLTFNTLEKVNITIPISVNVIGLKEVNKTVEVKNQTIVNNTATIVNEVEEKLNYLPWIALIVLVLLLFIIISFFYSKTKSKKDEFEKFIDKVKQRRN